MYKSAKLRLAHRRAAAPAGYPKAPVALAETWWLTRGAAEVAPAGLPDAHFAARSFAAAWTFAAALALLDALWAKMAGLGFRGFASSGVTMAVIAVVALGYLSIRPIARRLGFDLVDEFCRRASVIFHVELVFFVLSVCFVVLSYLAINARMPAVDADLSRIDSLLGFNWLRWFAFVQSHPWLRLLLYCTYGSTSLALATTIFYLAVTRRVRRCHELLWIFIATAIATVAICGVLPAMGAPFYYLVAHHRPLPGDIYPYLPDLIALRHGTLSRIDLAGLQGLVCLPSYHTVLLIMLCYALRGTRPFWAAVALSVATLPALPSIGGHYLVDIPGGAAVAIVAILLVRRWLPEPAKFQARQDFKTITICYEKIPN